MPTQCPHTCIASTNGLDHVASLRRLGKIQGYSKKVKEINSIATKGC